MKNLIKKVAKKATRKKKATFSVERPNGEVATFTTLAEAELFQQQNPDAGVINEG